ncbi:hypothetical protein CMUS01_08598 [Colletotrichum musicola]|uniref:Uncharacterized protein n=1 Tax=Colletotrichum musicola TaxID=2175873 RepID=A0A8H6NDB8_9PEZI|nr:hypothetical protein CMUS01_08598 [Colletotrichum musicola]
MPLRAWLQLVSTGYRRSWDLVPRATHNPTWRYLRIPRYLRHISMSSPKPDPVLPFALLPPPPSAWASHSGWLCFSADPSSPPRPYRAREVVSAIPGHHPGSSSLRGLLSPTMLARRQNLGATESRQAFSRVGARVEGGSEPPDLIRFSDFHGRECWTGFGGLEPLAGPGASSSTPTALPSRTASVRHL